MTKIVLCDYGCGRIGRYKFKNGKLCCSKCAASCPSNKRKTDFSKPVFGPEKSVRNGYRCRNCEKWFPWIEFGDGKKPGIYVFCRECRKSYMK